MLFKTRENAADELGHHRTEAASTSTTSDTDVNVADESPRVESANKSEPEDDGDGLDGSQPSDLDRDVAASSPPTRPRRWLRILTFIVLPALAMVVAPLGGFLKWQDASIRAATLARMESVQAAKDTTVAVLSYQPDTVQKELEGATRLLTGSFKRDYQELINKVVIPGARQQHIATTATVPAAASISASANDASVLVYVNQTTAIGTTGPTDLQSTVRVAMQKIDGRWLMSEFTPE